MYLWNNVYVRIFICVLNICVGVAKLPKSQRVRLKVEILGINIFYTR
jgi:hypothetical protein